LDKKPILYVVISAALFGLSSPLAKLLLNDISPVMLAGLLYLGAFLGLFLYSLADRNKTHRTKAPPLGKRDLPWLAGAILAGGIIAPISQMIGLNLISGFSVSLLLNLEGVATAIIAVLFFRENSGKRLWLALILMTIAGILLSWDPGQSQFSIAGPLLILLAVVSWGIDNNLTRQISDKNPIQITYLKGLIGGAVSLTVALVLGKPLAWDYRLPLALLLGAMSYGISLVFFIKALQGLGSSRTGAFFSLGPFVGAVASVIILKDWIGWVMFPAIILMGAGVWLIVNEKHEHAHVHPAVTHTHMHRHDDLHHLHMHPEGTSEPHSHEHTHPETRHIHAHWPDTQHRHMHAHE
jgi:drug/metabolite transporter (DMT)-like permease